MSPMRMLSEAPVTQSTAAIVELLNFLGKTSNPLPDAVELPGMILILSNRKDVYYTTTAKSCSCPSAAYRPGQKCKHQRQHYSEKDIERQNTLEAPDSICLSGKWPGGFNGPVDIENIKARTAPNKAGA